MVLAKNNRGRNNSLACGSTGVILLFRNRCTGLFALILISSLYLRQTESLALENVGNLSAMRRSLVGLKLNGETCLDKKECDYNAHLRCLERKCQCYGRVVSNMPGVRDLQMQWDSQRKKCLAIPGSSCTGTNYNPPPPNKIHVECIKNFMCVQEDPLDSSLVGIGVCRAPFVVKYQQNYFNDDSPPPESKSHSATHVGQLHAIVFTLTLCRLFPNIHFL